MARVLQGTMHAVFGMMVYARARLELVHGYPMSAHRPKHPGTDILDAFILWNRIPEGLAAAPKTHLRNFLPASTRFGREDAEPIKQAIKLTFLSALQNGHGRLKLPRVALEGRLHDALSRRRSAVSGERGKGIARCAGTLDLVSRRAKDRRF